MVYKCGAHERSIAKVKVMRVRVDGLRAVKDECWDLTEGSESSGDQLWWLTPETRTHRGRGGAGRVAGVIED
jgi:hypothetical protein